MAQITSNIFTINVNRVTSTVKTITSDIFTINVNRKTNAEEDLTTQIIIYKGVNELTAVNHIPSAGEYQVTITSTKNCTAELKTDNKTIKLLSVYSSTGQINIAINVENVKTYNKTISVASIMSNEVIQETIVKQSKLEQSLDGFRQTVSNTYATNDALGTVRNDVSRVEQTANKINWIVQDGTSSSSVTLTPYVIQLIADSDIKLSAKKILINGLLSGTGWQVDEEGNLDINDLNIRGTFTCNSINVDNLVSANIPNALPGTKNIIVATGESLNEYLDSLPLNLGGYSVNISLSGDISENIELRRHYNGIVNIFLCGYTIKGSICGTYNNAIYNIFGGKTSEDTLYGKVMPYKGYNIGSYYYSVVFLNCPNVNLYNVKIYGDKVNTTSSVGIGGQQKSKIYMENITFVGCKYNMRTYSMAEVYCHSSSGTSTGNSWSAGTGSRITLNATTQAGGGNNTYTSGNGQIISTGVTFSSTADSGSNTSSSSNTTTKVETYKPNYADTYRSSVYNNWKRDGICRQGNWGYGNCNGCWFYGSQFEEVKGKNITKVTITVTRSSSTGNSSAVSHVFQAHTHTSRPSGMPSYTTCNTTLSLAWGETGTVTITDATILAGIKNGTIKGFGIKASYTKANYSALTNGTVKIYYKE